METNYSKQAVISRGKEPYLKIPAHILNVPDIGLSEKVLLAHFYSFGERGCWQSNETISEIFMVSKGSIKRWITTLKKYIYIKNPKGYYRRIWAKSHPDVKESVGQWIKNEPGVAQKSPFDWRKNAIRVGQKCATTNNNTITENNIRTTATPAPTPAVGQASALLAERQKDAKAVVERFKHSFDKEEQWQPLTQEQFEIRKAQQIAALFAADRLAKINGSPKYGNEDG